METEADDDDEDDDDFISEEGTVKSPDTPSKDNANSRGRLEQSL